MSTCGFPLCQPKQRIQQPCPKHPLVPLSHFCASHSCLQMLCENCLKQHQLNHQQVHTSARICPLVDIQHYYQRITEKQLDYQKERQAREGSKNPEKRVDPCEILCEYVDQFFYGSTENKIENLKARKESLEKVNTKAFIDIVQRSSHYKIEDNFKQRYFAFLDSLLGKFYHE